MAKSEYVLAVEELLALMEKVEQPIRDSIATLERMRRLRFRSPIREREAAAQVREAIEVLAPFAKKYNLSDIAAQFRRSEEIARAAAKES
ncbi:MAG: hypothetical protein ABSC63_10640 [Candidatus Binataceae bacterium]|jgi:hypothetical protein